MSDEYFKFHKVMYDIIQATWKTFISLCSKFIQEFACHILLESPKFYRRYYKKNTLVSFFDTLYIILRLFGPIVALVLQM